MRKRLTRCLGVFVMATLVLSLFQFGSAAMTDGLFVAEDFTRFTAKADLNDSLQISTNSGSAVDADLVSSPASGITKGMKISVDKTGDSNTGFDVALLLASGNDWTGASGIRLWVKNLDTEHDHFIINIGFRQADDKKWRGKESGVFYTLYATDGTTKHGTLNGGGVMIPKNFEGYIEFPIEAFEPEIEGTTLNLSDIAKLHIGGDANNMDGGSLVVGKLIAYQYGFKAAEDFTRFTAKADLNDALQLSTNSGSDVDADLISNPAAGISKAMKISVDKAGDSNTGFDVALLLAAGNDWTGANGVRFWAKNMDTEHDHFIINLGFRQADDKKWRGKESGVCYTLRATDGTLTRGTLNGGGVMIPKGFEGYIEFPISAFEPEIEGTTLNLSDIAKFHISGDANNVDGGSLVVANLEIYGQALADNEQPGDPTESSASSTEAGTTATEKSNAPTNVSSNSVMLVILAAGCVITATGIAVARKKQSAR